MKAVGLKEYLPIENDNSLFDFEADNPQAAGKDLLVEVKAISVNPVDTKIRAPKDGIEDPPKILGWDAAGTVVSVGDAVTHYKVGDDVFYAGDITRPGSNSQYQLVDERIVGIKPSSLDYANAAALPLTSITAWEALFDRLNISKQGDDEGKSILIIGGAGGVGSIAIQLAKKLAKLTVIASASRADTIEWCKKLGADHTVNHRNDLIQEMKAIGFDGVDYIFCLNDTDGHWNTMATLINPQGMICTIVENKTALNMDQLKLKSAGLIWELMYTRSMFQTEDMDMQRQLLNEVSELVDNGTILNTCKEVITPINAQNLRAAHTKIESGTVIGKIVLADW